ncbi:MULTISPECIES: HEAT repeat domain-containing protein [unclassified Microbacterium]|uniref:HEAT repeat domain-containing protein n=1 Tax=unclassified Microbacterium TaxID=2609290 RepID=UPI00214BCBA8|nr:MULTISPECIES: HEAT repeat domain-containing protein [unclassified Microbacterium]MCR2785853.1 HEAT repeat domain-containing protein [Microbacterium sp. zg.B96]WIM17170.1 HEAT repeat domain-containing protein [Microbacterium sp. zg-B96]
MTGQHATSAVAQLHAALTAADASARLQAALTAGTHPHSQYVDVLVQRCALEPDFSVRDMLTWALTRHERTVALDRLLPELASAIPQARSQALHTLSKIGDPGAWPAITAALLRDDDDDVARAAWRTAAGLAPEAARPALARELASQLGRGGRDLQRSLSRALAALGAAADEVVGEASVAADSAVRAHGLATAHLRDHPDDGFDAAVAHAQRVVAVRSAPKGQEG